LKKENKKGGRKARGYEEEKKPKTKIQIQRGRKWWRQSNV